MNVQTIISKYFLPTSFELIGLGVMSLTLLLLGSSKQLMTYYGLTSSNQLIGSSAQVAVQTGLAQLDSFSITAKVVTFIIWSVIGLLCFSITRALGRVYREFKLDQALSSNRFIHPSTFVRARFWKQVCWDFVLLLLSLGILLAACYSFFAFSLPAALAYSRTFLLGTSLMSVFMFVIGLAVMYVSLLLLAVTLRLVVHHHELSRGFVR